MSLAVTASLTLLFAAGNAFGASAVEFYQNLLQRGVSDFNAGRFDAAERELRISAFGLVDLIDQYQTAHVYLALSADRLGHTDEARRAVDRVQVAQRVQARYAMLPLPAEVRGSFDALVQRLTPTASAPLGVTPNATRPATAPVPPRTTVQLAPPPPPPPPQASASAMQPPSSAATPPPPASTAGRDLASADHALAADDLLRARAVYRQNLETAADHTTLLRIAEGLYRARDFAGALLAFDRVGELRSGEQPYQYYRAVAYYETGDYARAQAALQAALPYIEITDDVAGYRAKIMRVIN
jgi:tetratricopeptide (TPR) repeat protein